MKHAIEDWKNIERWANIYGAQFVPIYPGRYRFICGRGGKQSVNILHAKWDLNSDDDKGKQFIRLDNDFDNWVKKQKKLKKKGGRI
jgi:hypothetical protein